MIGTQYTDENLVDDGNSAILCAQVICMFHLVSLEVYKTQAEDEQDWPDYREKENIKVKAKTSTVRVFFVDVNQIYRIIFSADWCFTQHILLFCSVLVCEFNYICQENFLKSFVDYLRKKLLNYGKT